MQQYLPASFSSSEKVPLAYNGGGGDSDGDEDDDHLRPEGPVFASIAPPPEMMASVHPDDVMLDAKIVVLPPGNEQLDLHPKKVDAVDYGPFDHDSPFNAYELFKAIFLTVTFVVPIKIVLLVVLFCFASLFGYLSVLGLNVSPKNEYGWAVPPPYWRRALTKPIGWLARAMLFVAGFFWISVKGSPAKVSIAPILVSNHVSIADMFVMTWQALPMFVAKDVVAATPLLGSCAIAIGCIFVERDNKESRSIVQEQILKRVDYNTAQLQPTTKLSSANSGESTHVSTDSMEGGVENSDALYPPLLVFPEGTTCNQRAIVKFKPGCFRAGKAVQPVALRYPYRYFNPSYTGKDKTTLELVFRLLCQFRLDLEVTYLDPIIPTEAEINDEKLFAENVRCKIAQHLNVPTLDIYAY